MGKVFKNKICDICKERSKKVIEAWGTKYCPDCFEKRPKSGRPGHSGMRSKPTELLQSMFAFDNDIKLLRVPKGHSVFSTLFLAHYPESKGIVGRQCNYLIERGGKTLGIIGANSPPLHYKLFESFFPGYTEDNWLNNNVFRLIENEKNLGTKILKMFRRQIKIDYEKQYKHKLIGLITFVEPPRSGAMYKADNWSLLGMTQGVQCKRRGSLDKWVNKEWSVGTKKHIYARWLCNKYQRKIKEGKCMVEQMAMDGIVMPDDEDRVIVPAGYEDSVITKEHFTQKGESIVTCNMLVEDLQNQIGKEVMCPNCSKKFMVVRQEDMAKKG